MKWLMSGLLALSAFTAGSVQAHEFWMIPHDAQSHVDAQVLFELRIGSGIPGKQTTRIPGLVADFSAFDSQGRYDVSGHDNSLVIGHLRPRHAGATIAALRTNEAQISLPASEFEEYLREEGLDKIIRQRQQDGESDQPDNELYSRCAKSIILVDGQSQGFDRAVGMPLELIPMTEPLGYQPQQAYRLHLLRDGKPLAGAQVKAQLRGEQVYQLKSMTDASGVAVFTLPEPGVWLFSSVDMEPSQNPDADWQSLWASVTIDIGEKAG